MQKAKKLKIVNWSLLTAMALTLTTSIWLEATDSTSAILVWHHVGIATVAVLLGVEHIRLHFGWSNWFKKFSKMKKQAVRILWWLFLLLVISAIIALAHWIVTGMHSPVGGVHGKIGFLMIIFAIGHVAKRFKYFA